MKKTFTYETRSGKLIERKLPTYNEVCGRCQGTGRHLRSGMEGVAYTVEDFADDPDFEEAYFGGRYDIPCQDCYGVNVVPVVDEDSLTRSEARFWAQVQRVERMRLRFEEEDRHLMFLENGGHWGA
jgi:hypothetical protein